MVPPAFESICDPKLEMSGLRIVIIYYVKNDTYCDVHYVYIFFYKCKHEEIITYHDIKIVGIILEYSVNDKEKQALLHINRTIFTIVL